MAAAELCYNGKVKWIGAMPCAGGSVRSNRSHDEISVWPTRSAKPKLSMNSLASLLFYFGMITVQGRNEQGQLRLCIPNLVTHGLYFEQLRELLLPDEFDQDE